MPPIDNHYCSRTGCGYQTTASDAAGAEKQLAAAGGFNHKKASKCPTCGEDSLVFLYDTHA